MKLTSKVTQIYHSCYSRAMIVNCPRLSELNPIKSNEMIGYICFSMILKAVQRLNHEVWDVSIWFSFLDFERFNVNQTVENRTSGKYITNVGKSRKAKKINDKSINSNIINTTPRNKAKRIKTLEQDVAVSTSSIAVSANVKMMPRDRAVKISKNL